MKRASLDRVTVHVHGELPVVVAAQKRALQSIGFSNIKSSVALPDLEGYSVNRAFDFVLLNIGPRINPRHALRLIRSETDAANPYALVIGCLPMPNRREIMHVIRMGVDGVISRPFQVEEFWKQLYALSAKPRAFVRTPEYFGPDRRRLHGVDYDGIERRKLSVPVKPSLTSRYSDELTDWQIDA